MSLHEIDVINSRTQGFLALFSGEALLSHPRRRLPHPAPPRPSPPTHQDGLAFPLSPSPPSLFAGFRSSPPVVWFVSPYLLPLWDVSESLATVSHHSSLLSLSPASRLSLPSSTALPHPRPWIPSLL